MLHGKINRDRPIWAGRVRRDKIAHLYAKDAQGIVDEGLIDDIGISFLARIESIIKAGEALSGRAHCPYCEKVIPHDLNKDDLLTCEVCNWELTWGDYHKSFRGKKLAALGIKSFCRDFAQKYPLASSPQEKMILIDTLIHTLHWELEGNFAGPGAKNLIGGKADELIDFLNKLTYGEKSNPEILANRDAWVQKIQKKRQKSKKQKTEQHQKKQERARRKLLKAKYRKMTLQERPHT